MKYLLLTLLACPFISFSQCPPDGAFNSQAEIDTFATDYPNCTELASALVISGDDITDLSGLGQITACTGLGISNNLVLQNTDGLNPNLVLSYVEGQGNGFGISNNAALTEITGLEGLRNLSGFESDFRIMNNPMLTSIAGVPNSFNSLDLMYITNNDSLLSLIGLENYNPGTVLSISENDALIDLTGIGSSYADYVSISNNNALQSLDGSESVRFDYYLNIENNPSLTDISAIYAGSYNDDGLTIRNNPNLAICNTEPVCFFINNNGAEEGIWLPGTFENNAPGCNSNFEVEYSCGVVTNDDCSSINSPDLYGNGLLTLGETITANNEFATTSSQTPSCNEVANRQDVWFGFNSETSTSVDIILESGFNLQLWNANSETYFYCGDQTQVADACGSEQLLDIPVIQDTYYLIQVWSDANKRPAGWFDLAVQDGLLSTQEDVFNGFSMYPNPVKHTLHLKSVNDISSIGVYNLLGQQVAESFPNNMDTQLNMENLQSGIYLIEVSIGEQKATYKIIKE